MTQTGQCWGTPLRTQMSHWFRVSLERVLVSVLGNPTDKKQLTTKALPTHTLGKLNNQK